MADPQIALIEQMVRLHLPELPAERAAAVATAAATLREAAAKLAGSLPMAADPGVFASVLARPATPAPATSTKGDR